MPPDLFVALSHRNFRLIWLGLLASITGSMMQNAGLLWHVSLLVSPGRKAIALGMVGFVRVVPIIVFSMLSGVVADAWNRRTLMLLTQTGAALVSLALAVLTFRGLTTVWPVYVLAALGAAVGVFDLPARQALVPTLVPRKDLPNAISLNAMMFQAASVVGPSIGGVLIAAAGVGWVYVVNALSFGCVILALLMMRGVSGRPEREANAPADEVSLKAAMEGLRFVFKSPLIRSTMLLDFFATFFSSATALLPIFAQDVLRVGATGYGWLYAAPALGAVLMSAIMIPLTSRIVRRGPGAALGRRRLRRRDRRVRRVALVLADVPLPRDDRRHRHDQHDHPQHRAAARDARSPARPHDRREHGVLPGRDRSWASSKRARWPAGSDRWFQSSAAAWDA